MYIIINKKEGEEEKRGVVLLHPKSNQNPFFFFFFFLVPEIQKRNKMILFSIWFVLFWCPDLPPHFFFLFFFSSFFWVSFTLFSLSTQWQGQGINLIWLFTYLSIPYVVYYYYYYYYYFFLSFLYFFILFLISFSLDRFKSFWLIELIELNDVKFSFMKVKLPSNLLEEMKFWSNCQSQKKREVENETIEWFKGSMLIN